MLHSLENLQDFTVNAVDGYIGKVKDFYFDDRTWKVSHILAETGMWFKHRNVLLQANAIKFLDLESKTLVVDISMNQVKNGTSFDKNLMVSPQTEIDYLSYYGYSFYRGATDVEGQDNEQKVAETFAAIDAVRRMNGDRHLRSCQEIVNYNIEAVDSSVGHLRGMLFDEQNWSIQYLMVNTSNWWLGHQILLEPQSIKDISWGDARVYVNLSRQQVQDSPIFDPDAATIDQESLEEDLNTHFHQAKANSSENRVSVKNF